MKDYFCIFGYSDSDICRYSYIFLFIYIHIHINFTYSYILLDHTTNFYCLSSFTFHYIPELHANPTEAQKTPQRYLSPIGPATWMAYRIPNVQSSVTSKWAFVLALNILLWCLRYFQHWMILIPILVVGNASAVCGLVQFFGHRINLEKKNM